MDQVSRIRESHEFRLGTKERRQKIAEAEQNLAAAKAIEQEQPDAYKAAELVLDNARLEQELFVAQHDTTGAMKGDRFGQDVRTEFESLGFERVKDGGARFHGEAQRRHLLVVNMGELDRLNDSGDHTLGDKALELAFARVQAKIRERLGKGEQLTEEQENALEKKYAIYRTGGADFSVVLKDVDPVEAEMIQLSIIGPLSVAEARENEEDTYVTASRISFVEAGDILGALRPQDGDPDLDATTFVTALKEKATTLSDFERTRERLERVVDKIAFPPEDGLSAEEIYTKYHQAALSPLFAALGATAPLGFKDFKEIVVKLGALEGTGGTEEWRKKSFTVARTEAIQRLRSRSEKDRNLRTHIVEASLKRLEEHAPEGVEASTQGTAEAPPERALQKISEEAIAAFEARIAFLGETVGEQNLARLAEELQSQQVRTGANVALEIQRAKLRLEIEKSKRDTLTGLGGRGVFFEKIERQLEQQKPVSIISVDMAFLKYFDREGGKYTGDAAIKASGRILDYVARTMRSKPAKEGEAPLEIEACRVGGDEFALAVGSTDAEVLGEIEDLIREARVKVGAIPALEGALESYRPESLQFNLGIESASSPDALKQKLAAANVTPQPGLTPRQETQWLSDHLNHLADGKIPAPKAVSRITFLLNRFMDTHRASMDDKPGMHLAYRALGVYSEKAIFGEEGKRMMARWTEALTRGSTTVAQLIRTEIIPFVREQLQRKGSKDQDLSVRMERTLEYEVRLSLDAQRISELEARVAAQTMELGHEHATVVKMKGELETLKSEHAEVRDLRERIRQAA